jgi:hypothetical protein
MGFHATTPIMPPEEVLVVENARNRRREIGLVIARAMLRAQVVGDDDAQRAMEWIRENEKAILAVLDSSGTMKEDVDRQSELCEGMRRANIPALAINDTRDAPGELDL